MVITYKLYQIDTVDARSIGCAYNTLKTFLCILLGCFCMYRYSFITKGGSRRLEKSHEARMMTIAAGLMWAGATIKREQLKAALKN